MNCLSFLKTISHSGWLAKKLISTPDNIQKGEKVKNTKCKSTLGENPQVLLPLIIQSYILSRQLLVKLKNKILIK